MKMFQAGTLKLDQLITHGNCMFPSQSLHADTVTEFNLQKDGEKAYSTFGAAAEHKALKMIMTT